MLAYSNIINSQASSAWRKLAYNALNIIMPQRCLCCELPAHPCLPICALCYQNLPWLNNACQRCAMPLQDTAGSICGRCASNPPPWSKCITLWRHRPPVSSWINQLKHGHKLQLARCFGILIAAELQNQNQNVDVILPVPLHKKRLQQRGFNQALEIARYIKATQRAKTIRHNIIRSKFTRPQQGLTQAQRKTNLQNAFKVKAVINEKTILIIDDVLTTGQTCRAVCKKISKRHKIILATVSRSA